LKSRDVEASLGAECRRAREQVRGYLITKLEKVPDPRAIRWPLRLFGRLRIRMPGAPKPGPRISWEAWFVEW